MRYGYLAFACLIKSAIAGDAVDDRLEPVVVSEQVSAAYFSDESNSATRMFVPLLDTPYSVGIVDQALLQDSLSYRLEDIAQFVSGVQASSADSGFNTDLRIRGFTTAGSAYLDGVLDNQRFQVRDIALIEQVDILKGHSSVLYGSGSPGGTVNYVSKKPQAVATHQFTYATGSYDFNRLVADSTGPLNADKTLLYRVIATGQLSNSQMENVSNDRATIAPSLTWLYADDGALNLGFEYGYQDQPYRFDNLYTQNQVVFDQSYVDPRARSDRHYWRFSTALDQQLSKIWSLHFASHYFHVERDDVLLGFYTFATPGTVSGYYRDIHDHYDQYSLRGEVHGEFQALGMHHWISGVERNNADDSLHSQRRIGGFSLNVFKPNFDHSLPSTTRLDTGFRQTEYGFYSNDAIDLNRYWHISAGLRYSLFDRDSSQNDVLNSLNQQGAMTYSGGLSFTPLPNLAAYYGYSQSFQANTATDHNLQVLPAKQGELHEVGVKSQWLDKRLVINAALYHVQQSNLPGRDPVDPDYSVAIGKIYSRGFELDAIGQLSQRWQLLSNYSWMEAKFGSGTVLNGNTFRSSPKHSSSLWTRYQLPFQMPGKFFFGGGLIYVDQRFGDDSNSFKVPGYLRTDLMAHYQLEKLDFRVKVENLFDKRYVSSSIYDDTVIQGNRLLFQFLLGIRFD